MEHEHSWTPDWWHLRRASAALKQGAVWAYPTEAVWGLGCDPFNEAAVEHILAIKARPRRKGLILVAGAIGQVDYLLASLPDALHRTPCHYWPGPTTLLLPDPRGLAPEWIKGDHGSVAVRVSAHPVVRRLCLAYGGLLVSTSCNLAGTPPARWSWQVRRRFGAQLDGILPGSVGAAAQPTRILDPVNGVRVR